MLLWTPHHTHTSGICIFFYFNKSLLLRVITSAGFCRAIPIIYISFLYLTTASLFVSRPKIRLKKNTELEFRVGVNKERKGKKKTKTKKHKKGKWARRAQFFFWTILFFLRGNVHQSQNFLILFICMTKIFFRKV